MSGDEIDPACAMNLVLEPGTHPSQLFAAISNSFAFGSTSAVLLFTRA